MTDFKYHPTTQKLISENYPYGFRLRTTKTDWIEFKPKNGFRHVSQTVNPKNGRLNKPKVGQYYQGMILYTNPDGHVKSRTFRFSDTPDIAENCNFIARHFDLFQPTEINYFYQELLMFARITAHSMVVYAGATSELVIATFEKVVPTIVSAIKANGAENVFQTIAKLWPTEEELNNLRKPGFNPFTVKSWSPNPQ